MCCVYMTSTVCLFFDDKSYSMNTKKDPAFKNGHTVCSVVCSPMDEDARPEEEMADLLSASLGLDSNSLQVCLFVCLFVYSRLFCALF